VSFLSFYLVLNDFIKLHKRSYRAYIGLQPLGEHAQKKPKLGSEPSVCPTHSFMDLAWELMHVQFSVGHKSPPLSPLDLEQEVTTLNPESIVTESKLMPINKSKKAQAHFAYALVDLWTPAFAKSLHLFFLHSLIAYMPDGYLHSSSGL
jgi:hypothetical protein